MEEAYSIGDLINTQGFELNIEARAQADLKFTYVVSCQIYGQQKQKKAPEATDIALLLQRLTKNTGTFVVLFLFYIGYFDGWTNDHVARVCCMRFNVYKEMKLGF